MLGVGFLPDYSEINCLVIEDSAHMRTIIRTILQGLGVRRVIEAEDGVSGIERLEQYAPDLVIIDWILPILNGPELVRLVRKPSHPQGMIPIIMISSYAERRRVVEAKKLGVHEFLRKPFSARDLCSRIDSVLLDPRPFVRTDTYYGPAPRATIGRGAAAIDGLSTSVPDGANQVIS